MFHVSSLVCFLIYGVNRRQVLIAKPAKCDLNNGVIRMGACELVCMCGTSRAHVS